MDDLISRQAAIDFIKVHSYPVCYDRTSIERGMTLTGIEQALNDVSSVQPKQKTGEWVYGEFDIPHCSICGHDVMPNMVSPYCPNCGTKMESEDVNNE